MERTEDEKQHIIASYRELLNSQLANSERSLYHWIGVQRIKVMRYGESPSDLADREAYQIGEYNDKVNYFYQCYNDEMKRLRINDFAKSPDPLPSTQFRGLPVPPYTFDGRSYDWDEQVLTEAKEQRARADAEAKQRAQAEAEASEEQSRASAAAAGWEYERRRRQNRK